METTLLTTEVFSKVNLNGVLNAIPHEIVGQGISFTNFHLTDLATSPDVVEALMGDIWGPILGLGGILLLFQLVAAAFKIFFGKVDEAFNAGKWAVIGLLFLKFIPRIYRLLMDLLDGISI